MDFDEKITFTETKSLSFFVNAIKHSVNTNNVTPTSTLNDYLRNNLKMTGTKVMCREGGCGVCIVTASVKDVNTGELKTFAVNSCLVSLLSIQGWHITTIEGLGSRKKGYHPLQEKMVEYNATQCGFCTPGMIMNMYSLQQKGSVTKAEIENSFGGNICRCTGYRAILDAFKSVVDDIEELPICKMENCHNCFTPCLMSLHYPLVYELKPEMAEDNKNWFKVNKIQEIFQIMRWRSDLYQLVAGNTAKGVYWDINNVDYFIDISNVAELKGYELKKNKLVLGGNITLTDAMHLFKKIGKDDVRFQYLHKVVDHFELVATVPVRNIGTLAGNLMIKYIHNEFPSDIFLLLEAIKATLIIDNGLLKQTVTPNRFLNQRMIKTIITHIEIPALGNNYHFESYKIMPRAQNAHAMINAAFLFKLNTNSNTVQEATIVYGGVNPSFVHAQSAERFITGKTLFNNANMQKLFQTLSSEINPNSVLSDPSPIFRRDLAVALMYKFILSIAPDGILSLEMKSAGKKLTRPAVSSGVQEYPLIGGDMSPIGKPVQKREAPDQASEEAQYTIDLPDMPGQLFAAFVLSNSGAGSLVVSIDASKAMKIKGVKAFYQAKDILDIGGKNNFIVPETINLPEPEIIFVPINGTIEYYHQPVGIIIGTSQRIAELGAANVVVNYKKSTSSALLNVRDILSHRASDKIISNGTIPAKHQDLNTANKFKGTFDTSYQYHYHMETQVVNIVPDDDGGFILRPSTQWIDAILAGISGALNISGNKLNIIVKRLGGAFGGKVSRPPLLACAATLAALKLHRPIKFWLPFDVNMNVIGKRTGCSSDYEVGFDAEGKIGFLNHVVYCDVGLHANDLPKPHLLDNLLGAYIRDATEVEFKIAKTDQTPMTWCRASGSVQGLAIIESIMDRIAVKLGKDPFDVKMMNLDEAGHPVLAKMMGEFLKWSDYKTRRVEVENFNKENRWRKRGMGIVPMAFPLAFNNNHCGQVAIYWEDGTVAISHGGIEMGQGINTKVIQVAAYVLGIDMDLILVKPTSNLVSPNNFSTARSQSSEATCFAVQEACRLLRKRIDDAAVLSSLREDTEWVDKVQNAFKKGVQLVENAMYEIPLNLKYLRYAVKDTSKDYIIYGIGAAEVEVDILTGNQIIQRVDLMEDVGDSMSPIIDLGQIEGAFAMGLGYWTSEKLIYDKDGKLLTNRTWSYKPPGAKDIPVDFRVKFPKGIPNVLSPYKTKTTGEPAVCLSFSVALAIQHAISSARIQSDSKKDPWTTINGPCSVEWTFINSLNKYQQYKL